MDGMIISFSSEHHLTLFPVLPRALSGPAQVAFFSGHWHKASLDLRPSDTCSPATGRGLMELLETRGAGLAFSDVAQNIPTLMRQP